MMNIYDPARNGHTVRLSHALTTSCSHHMTMFNADGTYATAANWRTATGNTNTPGLQ